MMVMVDVALTPSYNCACRKVGRRSCVPWDNELNAVIRMIKYTNKSQWLLIALPMPCHTLVPLSLCNTCWCSHTGDSVTPKRMYTTSNAGKTPITNIVRHPKYGKKLKTRKYDTAASRKHEACHD